MLNIADLIQTDRGRGVINILSADKLMQSPKMYATLLLWLLAELFENLPEAGDLDKPKLVFFFDEAHLLFTDAPDALVEKIEQVVRLIRSKGVGVYFVTQNPADVPDKVLSQLGNRVQHALRAFSPRDQKAVKAAAETMRDNPTLDEATRHHRTRRGRGAGVLPRRERPPRRGRARLHRAAAGADRPHHRRAAPAVDAVLAGGRRLRQDRRSRVGPRNPQGARRAGGAGSCRASRRRSSRPRPPTQPAASGGGLGGVLGDILGGRGGRREGAVEALAKSAARSIGSQVGRSIIRGVLGSIFGGKR